MRLHLKVSLSLLTAILFFTYFSLPILAEEPVYQWTYQFGGTSADQVWSTLDNNENLYLSGFFNPTIQLDPISTSTPYTSLGATDGFWAKYDKNLQIQQHQTYQFSGVNNYSYSNISTDNSLYVLGVAYTNSFPYDMDPTSGEDLYSGSGNTYIIHITKFNSAGGYEWSKPIPYSVISGFGIGLGGFELDSSDNSLYLHTSAKNVTVDFDPGAGTNSFSPDADRDAYLSKYSSDGSLEWTIPFISSADDFTTGFTVGEDNYIYITGYYNATLDFDPGSGTEESTPVGGSDVFIAKYSKDGEHIWTRSIGSSGNETSAYVAYDSKHQQVVSSVEISQATDMNPSSGVDNFTPTAGIDTIISRYRTDGTYIGSTQLGGTGDESAQVMFHNNDMYLYGTFTGTTDFNWGNGTDERTAASKDAFITKYNSDGTYGWTADFGGSSSIELRQPLITNNSEMFLAGIFQNTVDFDFSSDTDSKTSAGNNDGFIMKLLIDTAPSITINANPWTTSDQTPAIRGTTSDSYGNISNVEYRISNTGTWTSCRSDDGSYGESSEEFTCQVQDTLSVGTYSVYFRATDSNGNTTLDDDLTIISLQISQSNENPSTAEETYQIPLKYLGGVVTPINDSIVGTQRVLAFTEANTFDFNAYFSSILRVGNELEGFNKKELKTNAVLAGGSVLGIKINNRTYWQISPIQEIWYKAYPPRNTNLQAAKIIPELQVRPTILMVSYQNNWLQIPGQQGKQFKEDNLYIANSRDGYTWQILPQTLTDIEKKQLAVVTNIGGYYVIVAKP